MWGGVFVQNEKEKNKEKKYICIEGCVNDHYNSDSYNRITGLAIKNHGYWCQFWQWLTVAPRMLFFLLISFLIYNVEIVIEFWPILQSYSDDKWYVSACLEKPKGLCLHNTALNTIYPFLILTVKTRKKKIGLLFRYCGCQFFSLCCFVLKLV